MQTGEVQDPAFQRWEWRLQRIGWVVLAAFVVAAALGVFGPGPLSLRTVASPDGVVSAEYYRFARMGGPGTVTVTVGAEAIRDGAIDLWWNAAYLDEMRIDAVSPQPDTVTAVGDRRRFTFAAEPSDRPLDVMFHMTPDAMWSTRAEIAVGDGRRGVTFEQFIYP